MKKIEEDKSALVADHLKQYFPKTQRISARISHHKDIDDFTQECCLRIIEKNSLWSGDINKLPQWMNAVSKNVILRSLQRQKLEKNKLPIYQRIKKRPEDSQPNNKLETSENVEWLLVLCQSIILG